jgi:hypothetical protein
MKVSFTPVFWITRAHVVYIKASSQPSLENDLLSISSSTMKQNPLPLLLFFLLPSSSAQSRARAIFDQFTTRLPGLYLSKRRKFGPRPPSAHRTLYIGLEKKKRKKKKVCHISHSASPDITCCILLTLCTEGPAIMEDGWRVESDSPASSSRVLGGVMRGFLERAVPRWDWCLHQGRKEMTYEIRENLCQDSVWTHGGNRYHGGGFISKLGMNSICILATMKIILRFCPACLLSCNSICLSGSTVGSQYHISPST